MFVKAKQSGELLSTETGELWTPDGVRASASKIEEAHRQCGRLGIQGLLIVSGGGNFPRGETLRKQHLGEGVEDVLARLALIQNTLILTSRLRTLKVPHQTFIAAPMGFKDAELGSMDPYNLEAELAAYEEGKVVLIAGGTGEGGKTTDNAIMAYAGLHAAASPEETIVVLKGTKRDGVFTQDPEHFSDVRRYALISAGVMLADYERLRAVDEACLHKIVSTGLSMRVYKEGAHDLPSLLSDSTAAGTLIVPYGNEAVLA